MTHATLTRRYVLAGAASLTVVGALTRARRAASEMVCANPNLGDPEQRKSLHYVEASPTPQKSCDACMYFQGQGRCGSCRVIAGQVNPAGYCDSWSAKP
jgi:hypothetical protein